MNLKTRMGIVKNRFFLKMILTYCVVIFLGLGLASYYIGTSMTSVLTEMESRIDYEVLQKVQSFSDDKFKAVKNIFARLYLQQYMNNSMSIVDFINPRKRSVANQDSQFGTVSSYLKDTCSSNDFISDMFIVDYYDKEVFFVSNVVGRDVSLNYDFFQLDFIGKSHVDNKIEIIPNYIPDYINSSSVNDFSVISYCIFLFDSNSIRFDKPLGIAVINVRADCFKNAYRHSENFKGTVYVVNEGGMVLFDSNGANTGNDFPFYEYSVSNMNELVSNDKYITERLYSDDTKFTFVDIVDKKIVDGDVRKILQGFDGMMALCVVLTLLVSLVSASMFSKRVNRLVWNMKNVENGKLDTRIRVKSKDEFGYLESGFNNMCSRLEEYIQRVYVFELKTKTAELRTLQSQINPHFLFNTLESIHMTAQINNDNKTAKMIHLLGNMLRWNIRTMAMFVDVQEEIEYVCSYIKLQKMRYDDAFDVLINVDPAVLTLGIPKLILQPLVENCISHGFSDICEGGYIWIEGALEDGSLIFTVSDNGRGMDDIRVQEVIEGLNQNCEDKDQHHIGLSNVHQRIRILFGEKYGLTVSSQRGLGTNMTILLPAMSKEDMARYVQSDNS